MSPKRKCTPQLPCATNYGAYPKFVLRAGARVRIQDRPRGDWRNHVMRRDLTFDAPTHSSATHLWFEFENWRIYVRRDLVEKQ